MPKPEDFLSQTQIFRKRERTFRARIMIPLELLLHLLMLLMCLVVTFSHDSVVHRILESRGEVEHWTTASFALGVYGLTVAAVEWFCGERWGNKNIERFCYLRMWASLFSIAGWIYMAHILFFYSDAKGATFVLGMSPILAAFHFWDVIALKRVGVLLNPAYDTRKLEAKIEQRRLAL